MQKSVFTLMLYITRITSITTKHIRYTKSVLRAYAEECINIDVIHYQNNFYNDKAYKTDS